MLQDDVSRRVAASGGYRHPARSVAGGMEEFFGVDGGRRRSTAEEPVGVGRGKAGRRSRSSLPFTTAAAAGAPSPFLRPVRRRRQRNSPRSSSLSRSLASLRA